MIFVYVMAIYGMLGTPMLLVWSWNSWVKEPAKSISGYFAFGGLVIATISALFAICTIAYGQAIGGYAYYDRRLLKAYEIGFLISVFALALSLGGVWKKNTLRWLSPAAATGTVLFWFCAASSE